MGGWVGGWGEKKHLTGSERKRPGVTPPPGGVAVTCQVGGPAPHSGHPCPTCRTLAAHPVRSTTPAPPQGDMGGLPGKQSWKAGCRQVPSLPPTRETDGETGAQSRQPAGARAGPGALGRCAPMGHTSTLGAVPAQSPCAQPGPTGLSPAPWPPGPRPAPQLSQRPHGHLPLS